MQLTASQQYLVRLNKNLIYHLFLCDNKSLHYCTYDNSNTMFASNELLSNVINFSVTVDKYEKIHLICVTSEGELQHYINENNNWSHRTVSKFDIRSNIYKYLTLHIDDEYIHLLYVKTNLLTQTLSTIEHMYWNKKNINRIVVSNYVHGKYTSPLQVAFDSLQNFHIVYKAFYKNNHQLYYNKFNISTKIWTINELVTDLHEEHSHPYIFIDRKQNLHLVWCTIEQNNFILKYKKKHNIIDIKPRWSGTQTLSSKISNYLSPVLVQELDILKIYCKQNDKIIEIISDDFGDSWTDLTNGKSYTIDEPKIIRYSDNPQIDDKYLAKDVYGNIKDTIQIVGIDLFNNKEESKPSPVSASIQEVNYTTCETEQNNNEIIDLDKLSDTASNIEEPNDVVKELLSDYNTMKEQFFKIKEKRQKLEKSLGEHETDLYLLEEEIISCKKQILTFQEKLNKITSESGIFRRFVKFFK